MKSSNSKKGKTSNKNSNPKLNTIETESYSKFKNELFQKLFYNNIASKFSKERINSLGNLHQTKKLLHKRPFINKYYYKKRNPSYLYDISKSRKELKISNSKKNNNTLINNTNSNSTKIIRTNKISRQNNNTGSNRKLKNYPNLIKGVLHQVKYYNLNNNNNYNDNIRYKPVDEFFNDQSQSPIYIRNIIENNTNSPNNSINLDFKQEQKNNNSDNNYTNNIRKIKVNEDDNDGDNDNDNEQLEKEIRPNNIIYRKKNNRDEKIKNIKNISPIQVRNIDKIDSNDINEDIYNYNYYNNIIKNGNTKKNNDNDNENNKKINDENEFNENNIFLKNKNNDISSDNININTDNIGKDENIKEEEKKSKIELLKENNIYFTIWKNINNNNKKFFINDLKFFNVHNFSIINDNIKEGSFNKLEIINCDKINYIGRRRNKNNKGLNYDNNGNLIFNNDDEVLKYIKNKIKEEKDLEYNQNKMKYNYFILTKQFHGKLLYEIGLENNLNKINEILEKENVEVEHEPIMFIFKKDLFKLKNNNNNNNNIKDNEQIENLIKEKEKLISDNQNLMKKIDLLKENNNNIEDMGNDKLNENNYNKLSKEIEILNEKNKEKESQLNELKNMLNEYEIKLKKIIEENYILQNEKDKYSKYIIELQEYNEKIIIEYHKIKSQLEEEIQKNININNHPIKNHFNNEILNIITTDFFNLNININNNKKKEDNQYQEEKRNNYLNENNVSNHNNENNIYKNYDINNNIEIIEDNYIDQKNIYGDINNEKINNGYEEIEDSTNEKEESLNRALKRIEKMRENQKKNNIKEEHIKKSEKINQFAEILENKLKERKENNINNNEYNDEGK